MPNKTEQDAPATKIGFALTSFVKTLLSSIAPDIKGLKSIVALLVVVEEYVETNVLFEDLVLDQEVKDILTEPRIDQAIAFLNDPEKVESVVTDCDLLKCRLEEIEGYITNIINNIGVDMPEMDVKDPDDIRPS